jgi:hypothetical protein
MRKVLLAGLCGGACLISGSANATVLGTETFTYADGSVADKTGGTGWNVVRTAEPGAAAASASDWEVPFGTANVVGGALVTQDSGGKREYTGATEGTAGGSNEREGAFRASGAVFYRVSMTRAAGADWGGASSFDFNDERIFFGVPGGQAGTKFFGIEQSGGGGVALSTVPVVDGQTYTVVAMLDFDADTLALWVDPATGALPNVTKAYTGGNWSTAVRLASGGTGSTTWDNLTVADNATDVGVAVVPEPATLGLMVLGGVPLVLRRRR